MRLINTSTLEFKEFIGDKIPPYAILSHVWSDDEVSYDDYLSGRKQDGYGYQKIVKLCEFARDGSYDLDKSLGERQKLEWAWIDTCCIDKRSSAELSEAINSMYNWYARSAVCLVFLPDVDELSEPDIDNIYQLERCYRIPDIEVEHPAHLYSRAHHENMWLQSTAARWKFSPKDIPWVRSGHHAPFAVETFIASRWFTRGWTLQELIAPRHIFFYNTALRTIGHCHEGSMYFWPDGDWRSILSLHVLVMEATDIPASVLGFGIETSWFGAPCIAQKMSWASRRVTTRGEDMAYCLMGLFNVNMPLLYGEGSFKAFQRLQLEILGRSDDQSLFMWSAHRERLSTRFQRPDLLASSPKAFHGCTNAIEYSDGHFIRKSLIRSTQRGLELKMVLPRGLRPPSREYFNLLYPLHCQYGPGSVSCYLIFGVPRYDVLYADGAARPWWHQILQLDPGREREVLEYFLWESETPSLHVSTLPLDQPEYNRRLSQRFKSIVRRWINIARPRYEVKVYFPAIRRNQDRR